MVSSKYFITLDLQKQSTSVIVPLKHGENGKQIVISIADGGFPYAISNDCYAVLTAQKPDGKVLYNHCTINENTIIYDVTEQTTAVVGTFPAAINLYGAGDALLVSAKFRIIVDGTIYSEDDVLSTPEVSALTHLVSEATTTISTGNQTIQEGIAATKAASEATNSANAAAGNANNSATAANASAERANTATNSANTAAGNAQTAAQDANSAAANANEAARKTNDAIESAKDASDEANEATKNANEAATKAAQTAKSLMVIGKAEGQVISLDDAIEQYLVGCRIFGKTTQDGTPTPGTPVELVSVGDNGRLTVNVCGKNLLQFAIAGNTYTTGGITVSFDKDGCVANGTPTRDYVIVHTIANLALQKGTYYISGGSSGKFYAQVIVTKNGAKSYYINKAFTIDGTETRVEVSLQTGMLEEAGTIDNYRIYPMLVVGPTAPTEYEPYKDGNYVTFSTPNGLPGIPVTSGGNYTDANGQQWIGAEIDLARGVRVQRAYRETFAVKDFVKTVLTNTAKYHIQSKYASKGSVKAFCSIMGQGKYSYTTEDAEHWFIDNFFQVFIPNEAIDTFETLESVTVVYDLKTPIETPLSEEEIAAYNALHTYRDHATVSNDAGAWMELEYVMDAKKYIDSMISGTILQARVE